ncbi:MAG: hypothetical protein Fur003_0650 [Candidatus Dojkabacteria bacterium]
MKDSAQEAYRKYYQTTIEAIVKRVLAATPSTLLGLPGTGKSRIASLTFKELAQKENVIIVSLNVNELVDRSQLSFYKALLESLKTQLSTLEDKEIKQKLEANNLDNSESLFTVYNVIKCVVKRLTDKGYLILFCLTDFSKLKSLEPAFFTSFHALHEISKSKVTYLFIDTPEFRKVFTIQRAEDLYDKMMNSLIWLQLPDRNSFEADMDYWEKHFGHKLSSILRDFIWDQTHGHPALCKYLTLYFSESEYHDYNNAIAEFYAINTRLERIISVLDTQEIDALISIINSDAENVPVETIDRLQRYGLLKGDNGEGYDLTIKLLKDFLIKENNSTFEIMPRASSLIEEGGENPSHKDILMDNGNVYINSQQVKPELTRREYKVLEFLLHNKGKIVSRDSVARIIWGNNFQDKFSDWSLDQTISRLRKKIGDNGYSPRYLKTLRGRGFKFE